MNLTTSANPDEKSGKNISASARVLSGINPSSAKGLHLGNYFGAVKPHIDFQDKARCHYFVANLHALNTIFDGEEVAANSLNIFAEYIALGLDPEKVVFFYESDVEAIPYLQTIFNNLLTTAELKRMHGYKDKLAQDVSADEISMGLFSYPVLMAADILIVDADVVPVGEDQRQHVEICRDIARKFNKRYGDKFSFKIPEIYVKKETAKVVGIDGERKMSKSLGNDLPIFASEEALRAQVSRITTDPNRIKATDPGDPDKNIAFTYFDLLDYSAEELNEMKDKYRAGSIGDVEIKKKLADYLLDYFAGARSRKIELFKNQDYLLELRIKGKERIQELTEPVLTQVRRAVGV